MPTGLEKGPTGLEHLQDIEIGENTCEYSQNLEPLWFIFHLLGKNEIKIICICVQFPLERNKIYISIMDISNINKHVYLHFYIIGTSGRLFVSCIITLNENRC